jgi:hypothetical protein
MQHLSNESHCKIHAKRVIRELCSAGFSLACATLRTPAPIQESRGHLLTFLSHAGFFQRRILRTDVAQQWMEHVPRWISLCLTRLCAFEAWSVEAMGRTSKTIKRTIDHVNGWVIGLVIN